MKKIINPGKNTNGHTVYCLIEYKNGKLSISGVESPMKNGDCRGGAGQIEMSYARRDSYDQDNNFNDMVEFAEGWNRELWLDLLDIWSEWHLNDMQPDCEHQRAQDEFKNPVKIKKWKWGHLKADVAKERRAVVEKIDSELKTSKKVELTEQEQALYNLEACQYMVLELSESHSPDLYDYKDLSEKSALWVGSDQHPYGLLGKPCPVCGYKYGTKWLSKPVPGSVIEFLNSLPETKVKPAWI